MANGETIALTIWTFVDKVMSLLLNTLSRFVRAFLPRGKHHLISWLQLPCAVILEHKKRKICHCFYFSPIYLPLGFPHSSVGKESPCNAGDTGLIPGSGRSPVEGNGNPLQYSCLENPMDRGDRQAAVPGVARVRHNLSVRERERERERELNAMILVF